MSEVTIGSRMNNHIELAVEGFTNRFIVTRIFVARYQMNRTGIFDQRSRVLIVEGRCVIKAVEKLLMFLADKEQEDIDTFIEMLK